MSVSSAVSLNPPVLEAVTSVSIAGGSASQIPYQSAPNTTAFIPNGTAGQVLTSNGAGAPTWNTVPSVSTPTLAQVLTAGNTVGSSSINMNGQDITGADAITATTFTGALTGNASTATSASSATSATTSTNIAGGLGGSIPYQSAVNTTALLANGTAGQVLTSAGTTLPPTWTTPSVVTSNYFAYNFTSTGTILWSGTGAYTYNTTALSAGTYLITCSTNATVPLGVSAGLSDLSVAVEDSALNLLFDSAGTFNVETGIFSSVSFTAIITITTSGVITFTLDSPYSGTREIVSLFISMVQIA